MTSRSSFTSVRVIRIAAAGRAATRAALAESHGLDPAQPWLLVVAMMRPGDKLASYRLLGDALARGLDAHTAFEIVSIDIADVDVGANIGAKLQAEQAEADGSESGAQQKAGAEGEAQGAEKAGATAAATAGDASAVKVGRNDPCPCGSGKKFKKCCGLTA